MVRAKVFKYVRHFEGIPKEGDIELEEVELQPVKDGEVLFQALYLSVDPYQKIFMPAYPLGTVMIGEQVARVTESKNPNYAVGKEYLIACGWRSHVIFNPDKLNEVEWKPHHTDVIFKPVHPGLQGLPVSLALGVVGMPGATAHIGVNKTLNVQSGKTVLINAASGAVGQTAGQIAKIKGLKVIGAAGTKAKCDFLRQAGLDVVFNYKEDDLDKALDAAAPEGLDYYVDQVGGNFTSTVIGKHMKLGAKAVIIGNMSEHANSPIEAVPWGNFILKELTVQGLQVYRCPDPEWNEAFDDITTWIKQGKFSYKEDITEGFSNAIKAFLGLFVGENLGKAIVKA